MRKIIMLSLRFINKCIIVKKITLKQKKSLDH